MTVTQVYTSDGLIDLDRSENKNFTSAVHLLAKGMILCSDATLEGEEATGDPTEIALLVFGDEIGLSRENLH